MNQLVLSELIHYFVHFCLDTVVGEVDDAAEMGVVNSSMGLVGAVLDFYSDFLVGIAEWHSIENQTVTSSTVKM